MATFCNNRSCLEKMFLVKIKLLSSCGTHRRWIEVLLISCEQELSNIIITTDSISKAIDRLKCSKSQGPDNIHPMLLKECKAALLTPLKYIFEKITR